MSELARQHACRRPAVELHRFQVRCPARRRRSVTSESDQKTLKFLFGHQQLRGDRAPRQPLFPKLLQNHKPNRPEEHTSELKSLMPISYAVFCMNNKNYKLPSLQYT